MSLQIEWEMVHIYVQYISYQLFCCSCSRIIGKKYIAHIYAPSPTLFVDSSTEYWGGVLFPGCGQEAINLKGTHKIKDKIQKGQNALEAEAVLRGLERTPSCPSLWK
eukprot:GHVR01138169.1.p2 GENE.GHVR01138169.1~~GHVR01138169.1.p2  ORF type:complete len:107 (-),score=9.79 GHVR01138169.1:1010-1330(-)